ncbi:MAG: VWA domain-containing protein [Planctomycetota bacterium]|nr:VWA domain-containing protein [Planctomycetota bacterium]
MEDVERVLGGATGPPTFALALRLTSVPSRLRRASFGRSLTDMGERHLARELSGSDSGAVELWLLTRVVAATESSEAAFRPTLEERRLAISLLEDAEVAHLRTALLTIARRAEDPLRGDAIGVLSRWAERSGEDESVDGFLVELLGERFDPRTSPHPFNIMLARLRSTDAPLAPRARQRLSARVAAMMISGDWRDVARGVRLSEGFPLDERVPMLLDALNVWHRRAESGRKIEGLARCQGDLVRALRSLSGRFHGARPGPWIDWWIQVRKGELPRPGSAAFEAERLRRASEPRSTASFFGVRPETDRVTFVIDHSGSMSTGFGTDGRTRYVEAVEQMMRFLQGAPEDCRFSVILFSSDTIRTGDELLPNDVQTLEKVREELLAREPGGGTRLAPAVREALRMDRDGYPDLERLRADTIVVLCDGETERGPRWVQPTLERVLPHHPLVFHCVHLGGRGDGALRALAEGSGGSYLRVGG